ncbi:hypothetical protein Tco_0705273 [Tanacetum coccineum]|uniref:DUF4283 domain-containing protein n=1 Tax=Tanacetum coccineum TaxID=301880 RepID=A0ABQ4Y660_9ASTR
MWLLIGMNGISLSKTILICMVWGLWMGSLWDLLLLRIHKAGHESQPVNDAKVAAANKGDRFYVVDGKPIKSILRTPRTSAEDRNKEDSPSRKVSMSPIMSVHEFDIETTKDLLDENMSITQPLGDNLAADTNRSQPVGALTYATVVDPTNSPKPNEGTRTDEAVNVSTRVDFRALVNEERVAIEKVKNRIENSLVGYFVGKSVAFSIVQNYVKNTWAQFGLQNLMKNDDGVFLFKFESKNWLAKVLERGPWIIRNTPLILNRWTPNVSLKKDEVTKVPIWVKLHNVLVVAYSGDGLSLIATQVGKPIMLDAFTSSMCENSWGRINFDRALVEINADSVLKKEVSMAIPWRMGLDILGKVINLETPSEVCTIKAREPVTSNTANINGDECTEGTTRRGRDLNNTPQMSDNVNKDKVPSTSNSFDALNNLDVRADCGESSSRGSQQEESMTGTRNSKYNEDRDSDDEVDEFIFPEEDKFSDKFDIQLKGRGTNKSGDVLATKGQMGANSSIYKANGPSTSNSFDILNNVDIGDECGVEGFRDVVSTGWNMNVHGCAMYRVVKRKPLDEERFLRQKSKIEWLNAGDANTTYFHRIVKSKCARNRIEMVRDSSNVLHERNAVPDGLSVALFKKSWDIVGGEITNAVRDLFFNDKLLKELNHTIISLIPKVSTPAKITDLFFLYLVNRRVQIAEDFQYHHLCEQQRIVNLCFADDLFLFARGHPNSVRVIIDALEEFKNVSGLVPSIPKSTAFFCNVPNALKASILSSMPFAEGTLPVKYLGVPLISSRLLYRDCKVLVEKLESWVNDWRNKFQSLAGRGLEIRRLDDFNVALMTTHVWCILINKESYKLQGRSFWYVPCLGDVSWGWRKLLQIRTHIRPFIWHKINNGRSTSMWFDRWADSFPLRDMLTVRNIVRSGFSLLLIRFPNVVNIPVPDINNELDDVIVWRDVQGVRALTGMSSMPPRLVDVLAFFILSKGSSVSNVISWIVLAATTYCGACYVQVQEVDYQVSFAA